MRTALVNGRNMTAAEVVELIRRQTGYVFSEDAIRCRMRKGLTGDALLAPPRTHQLALRAVIDGEEMSAEELSAWIEQTRGYYVSATALRSRIRNGQTGERLLRPSRQRPQRELRGKDKTWGEALTKIRIPGWGVRT